MTITVGQLIERLKNYPEDMLVVVPVYDMGYLAPPNPETHEEWTDSKWQDHPGKVLIIYPMSE